MYFDFDTYWRVFRRAFRETSGGRRRRLTWALAVGFPLLALWDAYVRDNNVILPSRSVFEGLEDQLPPRFPDDPGYPPLIHKRQFIPPPDMTTDPGR